MDRNTLLAFALSFAVLTLWMLFATPPPPPREPGAGSSPAASPQATAPEEAAPPAAGSTAPALPAPEGAAAALAAPAAAPITLPEGERIVLDTMLFRAELDSAGAVLRHLELKQYRVSPAPEAPPIVLTTGQPPYANALATPFRELEIGDLSQAAFSA